MPASTAAGNGGIPAQPSIREQALRGEPLRGARVVDGHCHLGPYGAFHQPGNVAEALVRTMDRAGIGQSCVFSTLAITLDMHRGNDLSLDAARTFPGRLLAYAVVDPHHSGDAIRDELQRCFDAGARGIKLHTGLAAYPFDGPGYAPALAFADRHRLPLISHGVGSADTLRRVARAHPGAHVIVAHAGSGATRLPDSGAAIRDVAAEEPNVYLDITSSAGRFGVFATVVRTVGANRLLYGSDMPWMCATHQLGRVALAPIADDEKRLILGETLAGLLATRQ